MDDGADVKLFGCDKGKALGKIESHLITEYGTRTDTGTVVFVDTCFVDVFEKRFVLIAGHGSILANPDCLTSNLRLIVLFQSTRNSGFLKQKAQDSLTKILRPRVYRVSGQFILGK